MGAHLLGLRGCSPSVLETILQRAAYFSGRRKEKLNTLEGTSIAALFFEPSTRTKFSFEVASRWLSADFYHFPVETSSVVKGESLLDTVTTLKAMGINGVIVRHEVSGILEWLSSQVKGVSLLNAGDGCHEHPTQALLDLYTIKRYYGSLKNLKVAMIGDIKHSRVVRSSLTGLLAMGAKVDLVGPPTMLPETLAGEGVNVYWNWEEVIPYADVVYLLRLQKERQQKGLIPSLKEYTSLYGLTRERVDDLKEGAMVMHPGPLNLGVEITAEALKYMENHSRVHLSINEQVESGIIVRAAALDYLLGDGNHG